MTLPSSGPISLAMIQSEFGGTSPISISEYYGAASGIPSSGTISLSQFYGKSNIIREPATGAYGVGTSISPPNPGSSDKYFMFFEGTSAQSPDWTWVVWNGVKVRDAQGINTSPVITSSWTYYSSGSSPYATQGFPTEGSLPLGRGTASFYRIYRLSNP